MKKKSASKENTPSNYFHVQILTEKFNFNRRSSGETKNINEICNPIMERKVYNAEYLIKYMTERQSFPSIHKIFCPIREKRHAGYEEISLCLVPWGGKGPPK
jgi:hypothetical protein